MSRKRDIAKGAAVLIAPEGSLPFAELEKGDALLSARELGLRSAELERAAQMEVLDEDRIRALQVWAVVPGDRVQCADEGESVIAGPYVQQLQDGVFRIERYGYLYLNENELTVYSPLWIDGAAMEVRWLLLDQPSQQVTQAMIEPWLVDAGIVEGVEYEAIRQLAAQSDRRGALVIARATAAVDGEDARVEMLVDGRCAIGAEREDGSVDFRQIASVPMVEAGQVIARLVPARIGQAGRTVTGKFLAARSGKGLQLRAGDNVALREEGEQLLFVATMAGAICQKGDELSVTRLLRIEGDVDFHTGNLDFDGVIHIGGGVQQGFAIKATGSIAVAGTVEAGAVLACGGDLAVGGGIVGRRTRVQAGGDMRAQYVQEATVAAEGDIELAEYAYQARLRAGGAISVKGGQGPRGGSIVGGQTWGRQRIEMRLAGARSHPVTTLTAGMDSASAHKLDKLKSAVDLTYTQLSRLLSRFGLAKVDVGQIQNRIAAAVGPRRKMLANTARSLGKVVLAYQQLSAARKELEGAIQIQVENSAIEIRDRAYVGVEIRLGEHIRKLTEDGAGGSFCVVDGEMVCYGI